MTRKACKLLLLVLCITNFTSTAMAAGIVFVGKPLKSSTMGTENTLSPDKQEEYKVVITENEGRYYWATRENTELKKTTSGAFEIYTAVGGVGMIVVVAEWYRKSCEGKALNLCFEFDYGEHLRTGYTIISYYGAQVL